MARPPNDPRVTDLTRYRRDRERAKRAPPPKPPRPPGNDGLLGGRRHAGLILIAAVVILALLALGGHRF